MSDAQLLDRFVTQRDEAAQAAFEELVNRHGPMVLRVCRSVLHDAHAAEGAFQAVFLVLANRAGPIRRNGSVANYGLIVDRNANTFDFVQPSTGHPMVVKQPPRTSTRGAVPIYVVDRIDVVRVFLDVPEQDARNVHVGTKASVLVKAYRDEPIPSVVTRISWTVNVKGRALRAEIGLPNPAGRLKPGMYAYAKVSIERPSARALPSAAVASIDGKSYCWTYDNGRAVRTEIETGLSDGQWIEVIHRRAAASGGEGPWTPLDGSERVILGDLSVLHEGSPVRVGAATSGPE